MLKKLRNDSSSSSKKTISNVGITQNLIPIKAIENGFVITTGGDIVKILEIESCDYNNSPLNTRNSILSNFCNLFECSPDNIHFKSVVKEQDVSKLLSNIVDIKGKEDSPFVKERKDDYREMVGKMSRQLSLKRVYYLIFKLEGNKEKDKNINYDTLNKQIVEFDTCINAFGCSINERSISDNDYIVELFYSFLNPQTVLTESVDKRNDRIIMDYETWNLNNPLNIKRPTMNDIVSPKGIDFTRRTDAFIMDGYYVSYLTLRGNSISEEMFASWLTMITNEYAVDYDVFSYRRNTEEVLREIKNSERNKHITSNPRDSESTDVTKMETTYGYYDTLNNIRRCLANKQHVFNVVIVFTFKSKSIKALVDLKNKFKGDFGRSPYNFEFRDCYCNLQEMFLMTLPLMEYKASSQLFKLNGRNFVTTSFRTLMPFSNREFIDNSGVVIGQNVNTFGMVTLNMFNKAQGFQNANIAIMGETGSGKTFSEMLLCTRLNTTGKRTFYICPIKGEEYKWICKCSDGEFINLVPSGDCINLFEITAEESSDDSTKVSLLAQKITQILTFLRLIFPDITIEQEGQLNVALINLYKRKGFNKDDNKSIYNSDGSKKISPTFTDLYEEIKDKELLKSIASSIQALFIDGSWSNLNGQTNVDLSKNCIVINCDEDLVSKRMIPSIMYLGFIVFNGIIKSDKSKEDILIIDECWKFLNDNHEDGTGEQLLTCAKTIRSYTGSLLMATQSFKDYFSNRFGQQILDCCATKILKRIEGSIETPTSHAYMVCNALSLPVEEYLNVITSFDDVNGLLITPKQKVFVSFISTYFERMLFGTDKLTNRAREYLRSKKEWGEKTFKVTENDVRDLYQKGIVDEKWIS